MEHFSVVFHPRKTLLKAPLETAKNLSRTKLEYGSSRTTGHFEMLKKIFLSLKKIAKGNFEATFDL